MRLIPNDKTELIFLPCPFCGEEPNVKETKIEDESAYMVECKTMGCMIGHSRLDYSLSHLALSWNTRAKVVED